VIVVTALDEQPERWPLDGHVSTRSRLAGKGSAGTRRGVHPRSTGSLRKRRDCNA
jgi:hypothetical protein